MKQKTKNLATFLSMSGIDGCSIVASANGFFKFSNIITIAFLFIAGPGAIILASLLGGNLKERVFSALFAGILATMVIILAAGIGPKMINFVNFNILKIFAGIAIISIGIITMGLKVSEKIPFFIILFGLLISILGGIIK